MHWDHEPVRPRSRCRPRPRKHGRGMRFRGRGRERGGGRVGPFLESLLSLWRMHWDHERWKAPASRTHSKRFAKSQALGHYAAAFGVRGACSRFRTRFMESLLSLLRMHWDHEPTPSPSQEGNGQDADRSLFPSWEGLGVGRFMERLSGMRQAANGRTEDVARAENPWLTSGQPKKGLLCAKANCCGYHSGARWRWGCSSAFALPPPVRRTDSRGIASQPATGI